MVIVVKLEAPDVSGVSVVHREAKSRGVQHVVAETLTGVELVVWGEPCDLASLDLSSGVPVMGYTVRDGSLVYPQGVPGAVVQSAVDDAVSAVVGQVNGLLRERRSINRLDEFLATRGR